MQRLSHPARVLAVLAVALCFGAAASAVRGQANAQNDVSRAAATAIAHGKRAEAERLATYRGAAIRGGGRAGAARGASR